jgi:hypothetical protein
MFTEYLCERFRPPVFGTAAIGVVAAASWASSAKPSVMTLGFAILLASLLLLQFRLWDDLEDRERDSSIHAERTLVRAPAAPFHRTLSCLALANLAAGVYAGWSTAAGIAGLDFAFYVAYRFARGHIGDAVWRFSILLSKYPAFVVLTATVLGPPRVSRLAAASLAAYAAAYAYEALHDGGGFAGVDA